MVAGGRPGSVRVTVLFATSMVPRGTCDRSDRRPSFTSLPTTAKGRDDRSSWILLQSTFTSPTESLLNVTSDPLARTSLPMSRSPFAKTSTSGAGGVVEGGGVCATSFRQHASTSTYTQMVREDAMSVGYTATLYYRFSGRGSAIHRIRGNRASSYARHL